MNISKITTNHLSRQIELENPDLKQQINFIGMLEKDATMLFIIEKKEETTFDSSKNSVTGCVICIKMENQKIVNLLNDSDKRIFKVCRKKMVHY